MDTTTDARRASYRSHPSLTMHRDRLLPTDPAVRAIARRLYEVVAELPIISPHGHVEPAILLENRPFGDPAELFVTPDHYVTRLLHASGVPLAELGVGQGRLDESAARTAWRHLCSHWHVFRGTPVRAWLESELTELFGVDLQPSAVTADTIYDRVAERLGQDAYRPRALYERFNIDVLATTDDPADDLKVHEALADDESFSGRVIPTFRPDRYLEPGRPDWPGLVCSLGASADVETSTFAGYLEAFRRRRRVFIEHGATATDHSHADTRTDPLEPAEAERIHELALRGEATEAETTAYRRNLVFEMARMSTEDGLTMSLHPGVRRNHHRPTSDRFGADTGHDIPIKGEFTDGLRPLLEAFGTDPNLTLVLFTLDESAWSRELAPLAGFYPSVYVGAPWWFFDAPEAIRRFRAAVTETAGFSRTSGFIDDTRAFCSIPARHDMARRLDSGYLAQLVAEHRLDESEAAETATDLVAQQPRRVFGL